MITREWPPEVYGGAGTHVEQLVAHLRALADIDVHCFGAPRDDAAAYDVPTGLRDANFAVATMGTNLDMLGDFSRADILHSHTWYANFAGHTGALLHGVPHVLTAHSLEPRRPWKAEQLGGGYALSCWIERMAYESADAVIAVSEGMRCDILDCYPFVDPAKVHVVYNGIDAAVTHKVNTTAALEAYGIDASQPYVLFVGRVTRQKGIAHLLAAAKHLPAEVGLVLCASAPDTAELESLMHTEVAALQETRGNVHWIEKHLPRLHLQELISHAAVFVCPSVYEPLGIVNLEAMACEVPVVASRVGGIPEVVVDGVTGVLVEYNENDEGGFQRALAEATTAVLADPAKASAMGAAGRERVVTHFGWDRIAAQTMRVYESIAR